MKTKIGRNDPCPCGSGRKYKRCCGGASDTAMPSSGPPKPSSQHLDDQRYLLGLDGRGFTTELLQRLRAFVDSDIPDAVLDFDDDARYEGVIRIVPMIHRPTAGWAGIPEEVIAIVREAQTELVACLKDMSAREEIVVVGEGFMGMIDTASVASAAISNPEQFRTEADGFGIVEFIVQHSHVPVVGGDIPEGVQAIHEMIMRRGTRMPAAVRVFNALQEFRNRYAVRVAVNAATSLRRTPVIVFGLDHAEGLAHAARKIAPNVKLTLTPTIAAQSRSERLFDATSPLRL